MRYLKPFTFYPGEWAPPVVSDGCLEISLDLEAIWSAPYVSGEPLCPADEEKDVVESDLQDARAKIEELEDEIGALETKIEELLEDNRELDTLCTRLEDENETLKEQIATLLEKLNGR